MECKTEKRNKQCDGQPKCKDTDCFAHANQVWLAVNHNTKSLLAHEFDVQSKLTHQQVNFAAANNIYVFHEAMKGCKIHLKLALKM